MGEAANAFRDKLANKLRDKLKDGRSGKLRNSVSADVSRAPHWKR